MFWIFGKENKVALCSKAVFPDLSKTSRKCPFVLVIVKLPIRQYKVISWMVMISSVPNLESSFALSLYNYFYRRNMKKVGVNLKMTNCGFFPVLHELFQNLY